MVSSVAFVLGTRPEIIKLAPVIRACEDRDLEYTVIHTGQHYSEYLDNVFFEDLELRSPEHNLAVGSGSHAEQTGEMMAGIDRKLDEEQPDAVLVQGDTNSALAGGLVASKRDEILGHVEAGLRSYNRDMPEELNRILIDHVAERLFAPTEDAAECLTEEGIPDHRIDVTGNTIVDAVTQNAALAAEKSTILDDLSLEEGQFSLMTAHRPGNVDDRERFEGLLQGIARYAEFTDTPVIFPVHPRSDEKLSEYDLTIPDPIVCVDPLNFLDFLNLENKAQIVFTDSGGVQEETCILGTPCVTIREHTERPETLSVGSNVLSEPAPDAIVGSAFDIRSNASDWEAPFGDGDAAEKILATLTQSASELTEKVYT